MAQRIDTKPQRRTFYPWRLWTDGTVWRAVQGEDFFIAIPNFQTVLHLRARQEGKSVITGSPEKGIVEFQFVDKESSRTTPEVSVEPAA